jgi:integrase
METDTPQTVVRMRRQPTKKVRIGLALLKAVKKRAKRYWLWDDQLRGFGLQVEPSGVMSYQLKFTLRGRQRWYSPGRVGEITPELARDLCEEARGQIARGIDPVEAKKAEKNRGRTMNELLDAYVVALDAGQVLTKSGRPKSRTTIVADKSRIAAQIRPLLGKRFVTEITPTDVEHFLHDVAAGKTARSAKTDKPRGRSIVRGGKGAATRTVGLLGGIFSWSARQGYCASNPVIGVQRFPDGRSERFLSMKEMKAIGRALAQMQRDGADPYALDALRLLLLTGARKGEILSLKWAYVDLSHNCLRLPTSKTGFKIVPLGPGAVALIKRVKKVKENPYVFPGHKEGHHFVGLRKVFLNVLTEAEIASTRIHDLRHSFASVSVSSGEMSLPMLGAVLGHADPKTTARYAHLAPDPLKAALGGVVRTIDAGLNSEARRKRPGRKS